jgi:hypothetical protein
MQDSNDHYLDPHGVKAYEAVLPRLTVEWVNGGEHELTIGPHHQYVTERAFTFIAEHAHAT